MKIIYLHQYFKTPAMSGGTRSYEMAKRMVAAGHEVHMVTSCADGSIEGKNWVVEKIDGITVHWLPVLYDNSMGYVRRVLAFTEFARRACFYAKGLGGDIVYATSTPLTIAIPGVYVSKRLKKPLVFEVRDLWPEIPAAMGALKIPFSLWLAKRLERWAYNNSARVVCLSPGMKNGVARSGYDENKTYCIPNSSDIELFSVSAIEGDKYRSERSWLQNRKLVVYAGTFGKVNGLAYFVNLASEMRRINPDVRFLAIGDGAEKGLVREKAEALGVLDKNLFFEDSISKSSMPAVLNASTVCSSFVIPLEVLWNNSANKLFDAFAAGRPVIINHGGWQAELLEQTGAGLCLSPQNINEAARCLNAFLMNESKVEKARRAALNLAEEQFSRDKLAAQLIGLLDEVVAKEK